MLSLCFIETRLIRGSSINSFKSLPLDNSVEGSRTTGFQQSYVIVGEDSLTSVPIAIAPSANTPHATGPLAARLTLFHV